MIDVNRTAKNLTILEEDIWISKELSVISYPDDGNNYCFNIEEQSFWFKHRNNCIIEVLKKYPPSGTIYDVGGGNGFVTLGLKNNGFDAILVEPCIAGARNAKSRGLGPILCSRLEDAGFLNGSIPAIGIFDVLEHISDDTGYFKTINQMLIPDGRLYITVPAHNILWSSDDDSARHYRRYTLKELVKKLEQTGFEIEYCTYFFKALILPILLFRSIPSRLGLNKNNDPEKNIREHAPSSNMFRSIIDILMERELYRIKHNTLNLGTSCLIVAKAKK
jgi:SAM-dependent methyltransferase